MPSGMRLFLVFLAGSETVLLLKVGLFVVYSSKAHEDWVVL